MTLLEAVTAGDREAARKLLDEGCFADDGGPGGITPLMIAAERGDVEMVDLLLARGADPRLRDGSRDTALLKAAAQGHGHLFAALSQGAEGDELDRAGLPPERGGGSGGRPRGPPPRAAAVEDEAGDGGGGGAGRQLLRRRGSGGARRARREVGERRAEEAVSAARSAESNRQQAMSASDPN